MWLVPDVLVVLNPHPPFLLAFQINTERCLGFVIPQTSLSLFTLPRITLEVLSQIMQPNNSSLIFAVTFTQTVHLQIDINLDKI